MDRERLALEISTELDHLRRVAAQARRLLDIPTTERREWDAMAAAKCIADLWLGFENLCKRRHAALGRAMPEGRDSHSRPLTESVSDPALGGSLDPAVVQRLKKYMAFRHRFIHGYGDELTWRIVEEPLRLLPEAVEILAPIWTKWLGAQ